MTTTRDPYELRSKSPLPWSWCALVVFVVIAALGPSNAPFANTFVWNDKALHICAFAALALAGRLNRFVPDFASGLGLVLLAGGIELAQGAMGFERRASWLDFFASSGGVLLGRWLAAGFDWGVQRIAVRR